MAVVVGTTCVMIRITKTHRDGDANGDDASNDAHEDNYGDVDGSDWSC